MIICMQNKKIISLLFLLVAALIAIGFYLLNTQKEVAKNLNSETDTVSGNYQKSQTENDTASLDRSDPATVVENFLNNFISASPPSFDKKALANAVILLSEGAKMGMADNPTAGNLAMLMGVQDVPDEEYEIGEVVYKDNKASGVENGLAEINVILNYSGGNTERLFLLSKIDNMWQIDRVMLQEN